MANNPFSVVRTAHGAAHFSNKYILLDSWFSFVLFCYFDKGITVLRAIIITHV